MLVLIVAIAVLAIDQVSKYWITGQLGYTGSWYDLSELQKFLSSGECAFHEIPQGGKFIVLSFTPNDAALWGLGNGNPWASRLLLAMTAVFVFLILFFPLSGGGASHHMPSPIRGFSIALNLKDECQGSQSPFLQRPSWPITDLLTTSHRPLSTVDEVRGETESLGKMKPRLQKDK